MNEIKINTFYDNVLKQIIEIERETHYKNITEFYNELDYLANLDNIEIEIMDDIYGNYIINAECVFENKLYRYTFYMSRKKFDYNCTKENIKKISSEIYYNILHEGLKQVFIEDE